MTRRLAHHMVHHMPHIPSPLQPPTMRARPPLSQDYKRWKAGRGEFSFCDHAFVLEPASKSRVLMYDATAQMTHEFEGAILRALLPHQILPDPARSRWAQIPPARSSARIARFHLMTCFH